ncbi:MAG: HD domain-containing protein [Lachnospiraceae bacterium]|nr:HD domain-containing protein [Lachnospiraceae bacterium]MBQ9935616.1 HD domain-containing protein [Lachnospiraceae bacterium]
MKITYDEIRKNNTINTYIKQADLNLTALGFTEHSFPHVCKVAEMAGMILEKLGYDEHTIELARIAGYMHDIGNVVNRIDHAQSGAVMSFRILDKMGVEDEDIATIVAAIGNHDESTAFPVNPVAAALIIADKSDVRESRVRNSADITSDIHDRVNYAVKQQLLEVKPEEKKIILTLEINNDISEVMEYFEIFMGRMKLCKKAADKLGMKFKLIINSQEMA